MTKTIIMWSGGADSTCVVDQMLKNIDDELVLCHIVFDNDIKSAKDIEDLRFRKHTAIAAAQLVAIKQIAAYWERGGYRPFTVDVMPYHFPQVTHCSSHRAALPFLGAVAVRNHNADRYMTGITPITLRLDVWKKRTENDEAIFNTMMQRPITKPTIRNDLSLPGPKLVPVLVENRYANIKWEKPLVEWKWEKQAVANRLSPEIRKLVVTCDYPITHEDRWEPCEKCFRCLRWAQVVGAARDHNINTKAA